MNWIDEWVGEASHRFPARVVSEEAAEHLQQPDTAAGVERMLPASVLQKFDRFRNDRCPSDRDGDLLDGLKRHRRSHRATLSTVISSGATPCVRVADLLTVHALPGGAGLLGALGIVPGRGLGVLRRRRREQLRAAGAGLA